MTRLIWLVVAAFYLIGLSPAVSAAERGHRDDWRAGEGNNWRLSTYPRHHGYAILHWDGHDWRRMPGSALDVGEGWVIGTNREHGGYGIFRWNGYRWDQAPGGAVSIGGSYERPWVVNDRGQRFIWNGYDWDSAGGYGHGRVSNHYARSYSGHHRHHEQRRDRRSNWR